MPIVIEHERDERWAWPKGMEDPEYGPFVDGVTRGREPHGDGSWHVTVKARIQLHADVVYERVHTWVDDGVEPSDEAMAALWARLDQDVTDDYHANRRAFLRPVSPPGGWVL